MKKISCLVIACVGLISFSSCKSGSKGSINPNFPDISESAVEPSTSIQTSNSEQVVVVDSGSDNQGGRIGEITEQDPSHTLCVIIDPAAGDSADLEVCETDKANTDTSSVNGVCPEADAVTRCASANAGSGPDFCQVTGSSNYLFVIMNLTPQSVAVAYEVVDVTGFPNKSCSDLGITEDSILADNL